MTEGLALSVCPGCCGASPSAGRQLCLLITAENIRSPWGGQGGSWPEGVGWGGGGICFARGLGGRGGGALRVRARRNRIGKDRARERSEIVVVVGGCSGGEGGGGHSCLSLYLICLEKLLQ